MKKFLDKYKTQITKYFLPFAVIAVVVLILEVIIFNFRHWEFVGNKNPYAVTNYTLSDNLSAIDANAFQVDSTESMPYIELADIDMPLNLVYFDFVNIDRGEFGVFEINYQIELTDEGNVLPYGCPERTFMRLIPRTHYSTLNPYGKAHSIRVYFNNLNDGDRIRVNAFVLNPQYEMMVSKKRMIALFVLFSLLWVIRPSSSLYSHSVLDSFKWKKLALIGVCLAEIFIFYKVIHINHYYDNIQPGGQTQFQQLAEAIVDRGEVFLATKPQDGFVAMDDPYDAYYRNSQGFEYSATGEDMSDTGFYEGRYFVYFGVGPILLFYVPYYAITGAHIATRTVFFILIILNVLAVPFLLYQICRRYFKDLPYVLYSIFTVFFTLGAGQLFQAKTPDFYGIPIMMALVCTLFGLGLWIVALNKCDESSRLPWGYLAGGSLLMALTAVSRPQFLIASFLAIILFWNSVFKNRTLLSKNSIVQTIAFALPYVIVAAGAMYYNYIRFANPFDFGANYNLCYNDMNFRGFHIDRFLYAVAGYMFYPCKINNVFPYFQYSDVISKYTGMNTDDKLFGGVIYNNIYLIFAFLAIKYRKVMADKAAFAVAVILPIFSMIVGFVDGNMAGVYCRYYLDFSWGYMIAAFLVFGYLYTDSGNTITLAIKQHWLRTLIYASFIYTVIRWFLMPFADSSIVNGNQFLYHTIKNLVEFWN